MSTELQNNWIKKIEPLLFEQDDLPLLGTSVPFSWEEFAEQLKNHFELSSLSFHVEAPQWREASLLFDGIQNPPQMLQVALPPLEGSAIWVMSDHDLWKFFGEILENAESTSALPNEDLKKGFFTYLGMEVLSCLEKLNFSSDFSPQILKQETLPDEPCLCFDLIVKCKNKSLFGRLCISNTLRKSWKHHFAESHTTFSSLKPTLELTIHVEIGRIGFTINEWSKVHLGDFIVLEECSYDPESKKGSVNLTLRGTPFFHGRLRNDHIKLNDYPIYFKESMETNQSEQTSFPEDENEEDLFLEDEELAKSIAEELPPETEETLSRSEAVENLTSPVDLPLKVSVEIAHLRLTVQQLLDLSPGNQLSLGKEVDNLVDLIVNEKCIGKGELIRIGDILGVRILKL